MYENDTRTAKEILDELLVEYKDNEGAMEWLRFVYDEYLSFPPERARRLALGAEIDLSLYESK